MNMAYSKKLIHFATRANFDAQLAANNILGTSICFIKDAKQIWTHGQFYSCPFTEEEIEQLFVGSKIKLDGYIEMASPVNITETDTVNEAFGKIEDYLSDLVDLNAILVDTGDVATDPTINDYITPSELTNSLSNYATKSEIPTKVTELDNDANYATTDQIPTNVSQLTNDSKYVNETLLSQVVDTKQNTISDLDTIRSGAALGATSVQPGNISDMETKTNASITYATKTEVSNSLNGKVGTNGTVTQIISLTQSEYDALVSAGSVVSTTLYIITN